MIVSPTTSAEYIDLETWPRRDAYAHFRDFDKPYFNVCTRVDVRLLKASAKCVPQGGLSVACHYLALRLANEIEPFRYRLEGDGVRIHKVIHGGCTVLRDDDSFGFAYLDHHDSYAGFAAESAVAIAASQARQVPFDPRVGAVDMLHFTTLPWIHFSSFSHARNWGRADSIPKIAFGRIDTEVGADGVERLWMPLSVEVHHALMDGLHVGRYVQRFESVLRQPQAWLES